MPKVFRATLTELQREELQRLIRDPKTKPRMRERLERVRLSDAGMSIPKIAPTLRQSESRVRHWLKRFLEQASFAALNDRPHKGRSSALTEDRRAALRAEVEKVERTWTTPQLSEWLEETQGLSLSDDQIGRRLKQEGSVWKRTSLRHKQKPEEVEAKRAESEALEKKGGGLDRYPPPG